MKFVAIHIHVAPYDMNLIDRLVLDISNQLHHDGYKIYYITNFGFVNKQYLRENNISYPLGGRSCPNSGSKCISKLYLMDPSLNTGNLHALHCIADDCVIYIVTTRGVDVWTKTS